MFKLSDAFILVAALVSLALSAFFWFNAEVDLALFTGIWVPSILAFGIYFKLASLASRGKLNE
jgi:hypothetical protein